MAGLPWDSPSADVISDVRRYVNVTMPALDRRSMAWRDAYDLAHRAVLRYEDDPAFHAAADVAVKTMELLGAVARDGELLMAAAVALLALEEDR